MASARERGGGNGPAADHAAPWRPLKGRQRKSPAAGAVGLQGAGAADLAAASGPIVQLVGRAGPGKAEKARDGRP